MSRLEIGTSRQKWSCFFWALNSFLAILRTERQIFMQKYNFPKKLFSRIKLKIKNSLTCRCPNSVLAYFGEFGLHYNLKISTKGALKII